VIALYLAATLFGAVPLGPTCSVLVYHRFGSIAADSTTTTTGVFSQQIDALRANGYHVVPLSQLVSVVARQTTAAQNLVAITVDDGHRTVFTELFPIIQSKNVPVTLFIYPSAIGHASYAMDWDQLRALSSNARVEFGAHTYWHPDFRQDRQRLTPSAYTEFVAMQLNRSRAVLEQRLHQPIRFLAWPYGIYDAQLKEQAQASGYSAAFALGNRNVTSTDATFALPRHTVTDAVGTTAFLRRLATHPACVQ